ncbi:hypothetical protein ACU4HD_14995 [Cupriavidus basilensis]
MLAITFAGLLIVVQLALLLGLFGSVAAVVDKSGAELWIGFRNTQSVDLGRPLGRGSDALAWSHPGAGRIEAYTTAYGDLRRPDGVPVSVLLHAMDVSGAGLAFRGCSRQLSGQAARAQCHHHRRCRHAQTGRAGRHRG